MPPRLRSAFLFASLTTPALLGQSPHGAAPRPPSAEDRFFQVLVEGRGQPADAVAPLLIASLRAPRDPRPVLLLGLAHTWIAAEGDRADPRLVEHMLLADAYFDRVAALDPTETRLPSWQVPIRVALASVQGRAAEIPGLLRPLIAAFERDRGFHGFAVGRLGYSSGPGAPAFDRGLQAVRQAVAAPRDGDPSTQNRPRWPHNVEGFLLFAADYEQRAGNAERARALLDRIEEEPSFKAWPYRGEVAARRARWARGEAADARSWMQPVSCRVCHRR